MKAEDFQKRFDEGAEDVIEALDLKTARRVNQASRRVNVDFPAWIVESLDRESARMGVTRQSLIKVQESTGRLRSRNFGRELLMR